MFTLINTILLVALLVLQIVKKQSIEVNVVEKKNK